MFLFVCLFVFLFKSGLQSALFSIESGELVKISSLLVVNNVIFFIKIYYKITVERS